MRSTNIKPVSHFKANTVEVLKEPTEKRELALLKILALGSREIESGKVTPVAEVVCRLKAKNSPSAA